MRNFLIIVLLFLFLIPITSFTQESNCSDGIDNDGDGFIDCYDDNCLGTAECQGFFIVPDSVCSISPPTLTYEMKDVAGSSNRNVTTQARIVVGDVDNDAVLHRSNTLKTRTAFTLMDRITRLSRQAGTEKLNCLSSIQA